MRYNRFYQDNGFLTTTTYTQELSQYIVDLKYEDIPPEVIERAKMIMLQTIGVSMAAKNSPITRKVMEMALESNGGEGGPAVVWGTGKKMSVVNAALALGTMSDALDWEDCSWTGHPAAGVIPCAWLAAAEKKKSGKELLAAIVAGYEIYHRIAMAVQPTVENWYKMGWGLTSWQIFACVLPIAKLYGFDANNVNKAIGVSCENSVLPTAYHGTTMSDFYHYEHGYRARDGFMVAKAVEKGVRNQMDLLDHGPCYTSIVSRNPDGTSTADISWLKKDLGEHYYIMDTLLKHWPANMWVQTPAELIADLVAEYGFGPEDVEEIVLDPPISNRMWAPEEGFTSVTHAQFSAPFVISAFLYNQNPGADWYTPENMTDPKIIAMMQRVKSGPSPEESPRDGFQQFRVGKFPVKTLTVTLKDGRVVSRTLDGHLGHPKYMMSREQFVERFRVQAAPALEGEALEKAIDILCNIENVDDISTVCDLLL